MSNIIHFPINRIKKADEQYEEDDYDELDEFIDMLSEDIVGDVLSFLVEEGIDFDSERDVFDISLFFEASKSMILKFYDRDHPMQNLAINMYSFMDEIDENSPKQLSFDF